MVKDLQVLEIGSGDSRWYPYLREWGIGNYTGLDISENLIKAAEMRFPHLKGNLFVGKVEESDTIFGAKKFDLIFSYTCLEHIKEEDMPRAVEAIKHVGKKLLLVEPTNFISRDYCRAHDYGKYFKVLEKAQLKDKIILLCDLE